MCRQKVKRAFGKCLVLVEKTFHWPKKKTACCDCKEKRFLSVFCLSSLKKSQKKSVSSSTFEWNWPTFFAATLLFHVGSLWSAIWVANILFVLQRASNPDIPAQELEKREYWMHIYSWPLGFLISVVPFFTSIGFEGGKFLLYFSWSSVRTG